MTPFYESIHNTDDRVMIDLPCSKHFGGGEKVIMEDNLNGKDNGDDSNSSMESE